MNTKSKTISQPKRAAKKAGTKPQGKPRPARRDSASKTSAIEAAVRVLREAGEPMTTGAMIEAMAAKGYWSSPGGKTPAATLYSAILREITTKKTDSRFKKTDRGKFTLKG